MVQGKDAELRDRYVSGVKTEVAIARVRAEVAALHAELVRYGLVVWTGGNVSGRVPGADLFVIKPSGVVLRRSRAREHDPVRSRRQRHRRARRAASASPSSDTAAHAYVYRNMPEVGGVVHTHSTYAVAWAARGEEIPCVITGDGRRVRRSDPGRARSRSIGDDSIGRGIVETLTGHRSRAVLMQNHGPFTIGATAKDAVKAAVMRRGRRPHRAHRPRGRTPDPDPAGRDRPRSTTGTRTSTDRPRTTAGRPDGTVYN